MGSLQIGDDRGNIQWTWRYINKNYPIWRTEREKNFLKNSQTLIDLWHYFKRSNICGIWVQRGKIKSVIKCLKKWRLKMSQVGLKTESYRLKMLGEPQTGYPRPMHGQRYITVKLLNWRQKTWKQPEKNNALFKEKQIFKWLWISHQKSWRPTEALKYFISAERE